MLRCFGCRRWRRQGGGASADSGLLPALLYLLLLAIFPLIWTLTLSFTKWQANIMPKPQFVGLGNFRYFLFEDPRFWHDLRFTAMYVGIAVGVELGLGPFMASLLSQSFRGKNFFRVIFLIPTACPPVAVAFLWRMMLRPDIGISNSMLQAIGLGAVKWTTSSVVAPFTGIMVDIWEWTPFMFLAMLAALRALPVELYQSAAVDGASPWQMFARLTLPVTIAGSLSVRGLDFWKVASLSIMAIIPPIILALVFSHYLVHGLTMGVIKEKKAPWRHRAQAA